MGVNFVQQPWSLDVCSSAPDWPNMSWKATCFTWKAKRLELVDSDAALQKVHVALLLNGFNLRRVLLHTQKGSGFK